MGDGTPGAHASGHQPSITEAEIRGGSLVLAVVSGTVAFCALKLVATLFLPDTDTDSKADAEFGAFLLLMTSPIMSILNVCLCLPAIAFVDRIARPTSYQDAQGVGLRRPGLPLFCLAALVCVYAFLGVPPMYSVFSGHTLLANLAAMPRSLLDSIWLHLGSGAVAAGVYHFVARWMLRARAA